MDEVPTRQDQRLSGDVTGHRRYRRILGRRDGVGSHIRRDGRVTVCFFGDGADELFFPRFDASRASILEMVRLFLAGRGSAHAFTNR